jgi:hypothetical protein
MQMNEFWIAHIFLRTIRACYAIFTAKLITDTLMAVCKGGLSLNCKY